MTGKRIWRLIIALIIIAGLAVGGVALYQMGYTHGAMTNLTLPEGGEYPAMPFGYMPYGWHAGPRVGLLGFFPLLCFGGFLFLMLMFGFGFMARKHAWRHYYRSGTNPEHWKHYGPPPWGSGPPPWKQEQPETGSEAAPPETEASEG